MRLPRLPLPTPAMAVSRRPSAPTGGQGQWVFRWLLAPGLLAVTARRWQGRTPTQSLVAGPVQLLVPQPTVLERGSGTGVAPDTKSSFSGPRASLLRYTLRHSRMT